MKKVVEVNNTMSVDFAVGSICREEREKLRD
jgi:hypothetical protein